MYAPATLQATTTTHAATTTTAPTTTHAAATAMAAEGPTVFEAPCGPADADTHEGLRLALALIEEGGWESGAGRAVIAALQARCAAWAAWRVAASHVSAGALDPGEVLSVGWCTLARFGARVAAAEAPWAYLWTSVQNALAVDVAAAEVLSRAAVERPAEQWPKTAVRVGLSAQALPSPDPQDVVTADEDDAVSPAVTALIGHLSGGEEAEEAFWTDALTRALDVMDDARRTYEDVALRRDPYLSEVLGLSRKELTALGVLLIGTRRGDRADKCLLHALRADPATDPGVVDGALTRIRLLTARRHTPATAGSPEAVVVAA